MSPAPCLLAATAPRSKSELGRCVPIGDSVPPLIAVKALKPLSGGSKKIDLEGVSSDCKSGAQSYNSWVGNDSL